MENKTTLGESTEEHQLPGLSNPPNPQVHPSPSSSSDGTSENSSKDGTLAESSTSRDKTVEENGNGKVLKDKGKRKPRSQASAIHDKERGVCACKHCGWIYPNPRPSAKQRREHRKHCSRFQSVHEWLELDPAEQGEAMENESADDIVEAPSPRKVDEVPTDNNDQLRNMENVSTTGKGEEREEEEETGAGGPSPSPEQGGSSSSLPESPEPKTETASSPVDEAGSSPPLHDQNLETTSSTFDEQTFPVEAGGSSSMNEAEEKKLTTEIEESPSSDPGSSQLDLEKILKEQTSHHLLCPNCGSCITRRVILKKRKRTASGVSTPKLPQEKLPKLEEPKPDERAQVEAERSVPAEELAGDETEAWGCLACFSIFFHKVREQLQEPLERAHNFSCLPYLLPDFHWDGEGYTASQELPERERSTCLPIEFPWSRGSEQQAPPQHAEETETREVEIVIEPDKQIVLPDVDWKVHEQRDTSRGAVPVKDESHSVQTGEGTHEEVRENRDMVDCLPVLLPRYWRPEDESSAEVQAGTEKTTAGFNCLPALLPVYSWGSSPAAVEQQGSDVQVTRDIDISQVTPGSDTTKEVDGAQGTLEESQTVTQETTAVSQPSQVEGQQQEATQVPTEDKTSICLPLSLPNWTSQTVGESDQTAGLNCLQTVLPSFSWDGDGTHQEKASADEKDNVCLPITFPKSYTTWRWNEVDQEDKTYVTKETRIQAWIKTITNVVKVKSTGERREEKPTQDTRFLDMTVTEQTEGGEKQTKTEGLVKTPSTGWALLDALDKGAEPKLPSKLETTNKVEEHEEEDVKLIDNRKRRPREQQPGTRESKEQTEIEEVEPLTVKPEQVPGVQEVISDFHKAQHADDLKKPLLTAQEELDVEGFLSKLTGEYQPPTGPVSATVSVKSSDSHIEVTGDDPQRAVEAALAISQVIPAGGLGVQEPDHYEYVKSIVYGGLDVTLTSLAVVSSGAGSGTKTINVLAISLANLVAGLITLLHNIGSMYQNDRASFEQYVGKSLWINGTLSIISFLIFGCIAPLTYGLSFRSLDDRDYKFALTAVVSVVCIGLMGLGKAYVQKKNYGSTIVNLVLTGFVASVAGYFVGDYVQRWLRKLGYDDEPPVSPAPPPPLSVLLLKRGLELGRRGRGRPL